MNLNPNDWSCVPTAFANVVGMQVDAFIKKIGHNGSEKVPEWGEVERGFHTQECIEVLEDLGIRAVTIDLFPKVAPDPHAPPVSVDMGYPWERLARHMDSCDGVILGVIKKDDKPVGHAASWIDKVVYDPRGCGLEWLAPDFLYKQMEPRQFIKVWK